VIGLQRVEAYRAGSVTTTLSVLHPKGGVGRSTTVYMLGAELALRGHRVALVDRDQGQHLSRVFDFYPPGLGNLVLGDDQSAAIRIIDTAPEVNADRAVGYLRDADWVLVRVKGPEAGSVLALPLLLDWLQKPTGHGCWASCRPCTRLAAATRASGSKNSNAWQLRPARASSRRSATWPVSRRSDSTATHTLRSPRPSMRSCLARSSKGADFVRRRHRGRATGRARRRSHR
jgi:hypothetical protein